MRNFGYGFFLISLSILTIIINYTLSHLRYYWIILSVMGALTLVLGICISVKSESSWKAISAVIFLIVVGQWWFFEFAILQIGWSIRGFAP